MKIALVDMSQTEEFSELLKSEIKTPEVLSDIKEKVSSDIYRP